MKRLLLVLILFLCARQTSAQCLPIPNDDTHTLFRMLVEGKPFGQQTLLELEPTLKRYGIQLTPPNAVGERTKIGDPVSGHWTRLGFGEGRWVWVVQGDVYEPIPCEIVPSAPLPNPGTTLPNVGTVDLSGIEAQLKALDAKLDQHIAQEEAHWTKAKGIWDGIVKPSLKFAGKYGGPALVAFLAGLKAN